MGLKINANKQEFSFFRWYIFFSILILYIGSPYGENCLKEMAVIIVFGLM